MVYLREPGQSSRGPTFRIHTSRLLAKGFEPLLERCGTRPVLHTASKATLNNRNLPSKELYLPAPLQSGLDATLDHHTTTRNFFAWLYNIPLAGRALGPSLIDLSERLDSYRSAEKERNRNELLSYAESQGYFDLRECVDHSLATLCFAEYLQEEHLWVDAFAHCVGLGHRGLSESIEYEVRSLPVPNCEGAYECSQYIGDKSRLLIDLERAEVDRRLDAVAESIRNFFENELSSTQWGLHKAARDHLDRFKSFLHSYYIEQHGFWPPDKFNEEAMQRLLCNAMYSDIRSLYHHLADPKSSGVEPDSDISSSGGVCVLQNIRSFDSHHGLKPLPQSLPQLPDETKVEYLRSRSERRNSWSPLVQRKLKKEERNTRRMQALVNSTNRDWNLMNCLLVRRFSEFEVGAATDDLEDISLADGRKIRWIVVYAILQTLISVMQAPKQVRNAEGLSYPLCCRAPEVLPWMIISQPSSAIADKGELQPDLAYSHTNTDPAKPTITRKTSGLKERRETTDSAPLRRSLTRTATNLRSASLLRLVTSKVEVQHEEMPKKRGSFCEIYVPGYGNGLNEVEITSSPIDDAAPKLPGSNSVSRESSNASNSSTWSTTSSDSNTTAKTPVTSSSDIAQAMADLGIAVAKSDSKVTYVTGAIQIIPAEKGLETVHFNARTWTDILKT